MLKLIFIALASLILVGCGQELTDKQIEERNAKSRAAIGAETKTNEIKSTGSVIAKKMGGKATIVLPPKQKLVMVTWKEKDAMWFLYRPFRDGERAETYTYQEDSKWGLLEATITIQECEK